MKFALIKICIRRELPVICFQLSIYNFRTILVKISHGVASLFVFILLQLTRFSSYYTKHIVLQTMWSKLCFLSELYTRQARRNRGAIAPPPEFDSCQVSIIYYIWQLGWADYVHHITTRPTGFPSLPTALARSFVVRSYNYLPSF